MFILSMHHLSNQTVLFVNDAKYSLSQARTLSVLCKYELGQKKNTCRGSIHLTDKDHQNIR